MPPFSCPKPLDPCSQTALTLFSLFKKVIAWRGVKEIQGGYNDFEKEKGDMGGVQGRALEDEGLLGLGVGVGGYVIKTTDHSKGGYPCT